MTEIYIINSIGNFYNTGIKINNVIGTIFTIMVAYKAIYFILGLLFTRKFKPAKKMHKYGILIAARNEESVIGNLLDSINKQDYPKNLLDVFVVADNCTDQTANIARNFGAKVYERFDEEHKTKGFAVQYLFENIKKDYGIETYEGYFIFDADNLLNKNYVTKMNNAFDSGEKIITSYRNTKNFDENWIASTYALHWIRSIRTNHRARSFLHLATNIQGTGFLFTNEIVKNGWKYTGLTEDRALTADAVVQGYKITYQDEAEFFDEQPTNLKIALRQRLRWSKGHLMAFVESGPKLFINIFFGKTFLKNKIKEKNIFKRILESIRHRFASYDTLIQLTPISLLNFFRWLVINVVIYGCFNYINGIQSIDLFDGNILSVIFKSTNITVKPGINALLISILITIWFRIIYRISVYISDMVIAIYIFIVEKNRMKKMSLCKKILYTFTFPTFDSIGRYTTYLALFKRVTWKPIPHNSKITIEEIDTSDNTK